MRFGILSILILFIAGGILLRGVDFKEGERESPYILNKKLKILKFVDLKTIMI
ncbi:MAG: hypothetical protein CM15mP106_3790 [Candidatus Neomarinimicrobiota bacterium]|nr:MAG: hypothetical protein CM15mP106_3790 [Candidatus Neomarinimicrobiota bacterium]